ncbi:hypothetical protein CAPTEDRAFT_202218 [Capitella teleta]|uniref:Farnesoic acid O-methyl transferase domain-containing protein n=1 Tax=Capitella teleta TaxID=283909 RepID=R7V6X0_CAPTE|nr:hypothetical protein CAPTEDRAFT_202218 [Capitella teleta]|eukprot:ELU12116.1 hypothetical protein CAPTEDRAFT_202218 [Capitella teleta]
MKIFVVLMCALFADFAMGDVDMCLMQKLSTTDYDSFVNHYPGSNHVYFGIKACAESNIQVFVPFDKGLYFKLFFGPPSDDTASVWMSKFKPSEKELYLGGSTEVSLDCNTMKYFWMKWVDGTLLVGQGLQLESRELFKIDDNDVRSKLSSSMDYDVDYIVGSIEIDNQCGILRADWNVSLSSLHV